MKEKNILVVEDDLHMRVFITTVLETSGYNATATKDGQEGIRKVKEDRPDLIILDVMMPEEGGISMYRQLKTDNQLKDIPVVVLSGVESKTFLHSLKMMSLGLRDPLPDPEAYVEKPPKAEELLNVVQKLLAGRPVPD
ncbi:MAG: response regulator [Deltaproteobacteria bacterium]|nr:response regulator [Deltaproteobacteria bacterium]